MSERWNRMILKYGSEDGAKEEMRRRAEKSPRNKNGVAYFAKLKQEDPERLKEISKKGGTKKENDNAGNS